MEERIEDAQRTILQSFQPGRSQDDRENIVHLGEIRQCLDAWKLGIQLFLQSSEHVVRFFGLSLCRGCLENGNLTLDERIELRNFVWQTLARYFKGDSTVFTSELLNMAATLLCILIREDFPQDWEDAFQDIIQLSIQCEYSQMDFLVRFLQEFDGLIVSFDVNRSQAEISQCARVKDSLRLLEIPNTICSQCFSYISSYNQSPSPISGKLLTSLGLLADWSDVNIFLHPDHINAIIRALLSDKLCEHACSCLIGIVKKKMDCASKLNIILSLDLIHVLTSLTPSSFDAVCALSELVSELANAIYDAVDLVDDSSDEVVNILSSHSDFCSSFLDLLLGYWGQFDDAEATGKMVDGMNRLLTTWKCQINQSSQSQVSEYCNIDREGERIIACILEKMKLPLDFDYDLEDEDDSIVLKTRSSVGFLFCRCIRLRPDYISSVIQALLQELPQPLSSCVFCDLECILVCLNCFGDALRSISSHDLDDSYGQILLAFCQTDVSMHDHLSVVLAWYDLIDKQSKIFCCHSDAVLYCLELATGGRGIQSNAAVLVSRGAYLLSKILMQSQDVIDLTRRQILTQIFNCMGRVTDILDQELIYESIGVVIGGCKISESEFFSEQLIEVVSCHVKKIIDGIRNMDEDEICRNLSLLGKLCVGASNTIQKLISIGKKKVTKSNLARTNSNSNSNNGPSQRLLDALGPIYSITSECMISYSSNPIVRAKYVLVTHHFLKLIPNFISDSEKLSEKIVKLIDECTIDDVLQIGHLLDQFTVVFKLDCIMLDSGFQMYIGKLLAIINSDNSDTKSNLLLIKKTIGPKLNEIDNDDDENVLELESDANMIKNIRTSLFSFLLHVCENSSNLLISDTNRESLESVLNLLIDGFSSFGDVAIQKSVISSFNCLVKSWCSPNRIMDAPSEDLLSFIIDHVLPLVLHASSDEVDVQDGLSLVLLSEIGSLLYQIKSTHESMMNAIESVVVELNWDRLAVDELLNVLLNARDELNAKNSFRDYIRRMKT